MPVPHHSIFYRPDTLPATQPTVSKDWNLNVNQHSVRKNFVYSCITMHTVEHNTAQKKSYNNFPFYLPYSHYFSKVAYGREWDSVSSNQSNETPTITVIIYTAVINKQLLSNHSSSLQLHWTNFPSCLAQHQLALDKDETRNGRHKTVTVRKAYVFLDVKECRRQGSVQEVRQRSLVFVKHSSIVGTLRQRAFDVY